MCDTRGPIPQSTRLHLPSALVVSLGEAVLNVSYWEVSITADIWYAEALQLGFEDRQSNLEDLVTMQETQK